FEVKPALAPAARSARVPSQPRVGPERPIGLNRLPPQASPVPLGPDLDPDSGAGGRLLRLAPQAHLAAGPDRTARGAEHERPFSRAQASGRRVRAVGGTP